MAAFPCFNPVCNHRRFVVRLEHLFQQPFYPLGILRLRSRKWINDVTVQKGD